MKILSLVALLFAATSFGVAAGDVSLAVPGRTNATPWIAASGPRVGVAWAATVDGKADIFVAISGDGGVTFAAPARVNSVIGEARVSGEIAPRVSLQPRPGATPIITVTWNAKDGATQIKTSRSTDGGRTFAPAVSLQSDTPAGDRGWQAAAVDSRGALHAIWLDHRGMAIAKASGAHAEHKGEHDGAAMAQRSGLYYATAGMPERELFKGVCYCCKTAMAIGPNGDIYAAWRHVFAGNMRDMAFTVSRDGGKTFSPLARVNQDGWSINGCPDDGPAMAVDRSGTIHLVWPTVKDEKGVILYATSRDGRTFSTPVRVPTLGGPKASHPQIAIDAGGRAVIAWDEAVDGARKPAYVTARRSAEGAVTFGTPKVIADTSAAIYPVTAATNTGVIAAWTSGAPNQTVIKVRRLE